MAAYRLAYLLDRDDIDAWLRSVVNFDDMKERLNHIAIKHPPLCDDFMFAGSVFDTLVKWQLADCLTEKEDPGLILVLGRNEADRKNIDIEETEDWQRCQKLIELAGSDIKRRAAVATLLNFIAGKKKSSGFNEHYVPFGKYRDWNSEKCIPDPVWAIRNQKGEIIFIDDIEDEHFEYLVSIAGCRKEYEDVLQAAHMIHSVWENVPGYNSFEQLLTNDNISIEGLCDLIRDRTIWDFKWTAKRNPDSYDKYLKQICLYRILYNPDYCKDEKQAQEVDSVGLYLGRHEELVSWNDWEIFTKPVSELRHSFNQEFSEKLSEEIRELIKEAIKSGHMI